MSASKILIVYYSRAGLNYAGGGVVSLPVGNTEVAANLLVRLTGGTAHRIETVQKYPSDYTKCTEVAQAELRQNARPTLSGPGVDTTPYDVIILGYPNWWGTMPMAVFTWLEAHDLSGKTVLPLCTHEGSGLGRSESDVRKLCPGATVLKGLAVTGSSVARSEGALKAWLRNSGIVG